MTPEVRTKRLTKRFLVRWAFNLTQHIKLPDHKAFASLREKYTAAPARAPPRVQLGDTLSTDVFWTGSWSAGWARNWTKYWLPAESFGGQGRLGTSAMEDFAVAEALAALHRAGLVSGVAAALLVLRSASNFMEPPAKQSPVAYMDFFLNEACEAAYLVGLPVVKELLQRPGAWLRPIYARSGLEGLPYVIISALVAEKRSSSKCLAHRSNVVLMACDTSWDEDPRRVGAVLLEARQEFQELTTRILQRLQAALAEELARAKAELAREVQEELRASVTRDGMSESFWEEAAGPSAARQLACTEASAA
ncbi:unnamed protein product [Durusdinium trenchii]|uniref:Uncharacterized protein n=1 Tax=Durusdinium trenchii TaxID=1381693 RepID=A0ABP0HCN2_9DINO